jgi:hypothetical protein
MHRWGQALDWDSVGDCECGDKALVPLQCSRPPQLFGQVSGWHRSLVLLRTEQEGSMQNTSTTGPAPRAAQVRFGPHTHDKPPQQRRTSQSSSSLHPMPTTWFQWHAIPLLAFNSTYNKTVATVPM